MYKGSYAGELLFKARSQSLEVNARTYGWSVDGSRKCKSCESVFHFIVECSGFVNERDVPMRHGREVWGAEFMESWDEENECGICVCVTDAKVSMEVVKTFLESV